MNALLVCATIFYALGVDAVATTELFTRYGPATEANPIIRMVGPQLYFGTVIPAAAASCREQDPGWRGAAVIVWAVETWAISTHTPLGTDRAGPPLLLFSWSW